MVSFKSIGNSIKVARIALGKKQVEIAEELGCQQATIGKIESGDMHGKHFCNYLILLKKSGIDMNKLFEDAPDMFLRED